MPAGSAAQPITGVVGEWLSVATSEITGNVIVDAVDVYARDEARQRELDRRIIPWIPWSYQAAYLGGLLAGLIGWTVTRAWWRHIWPAEQREEYRGVAGYLAAQTVRFLAYFVAALQTIAPRVGEDVSNALLSPQPPSTESKKCWPLGRLVQGRPRRPHSSGFATLWGSPESF